MTAESCLEDGKVRNQYVAAIVGEYGNSFRLFMNENR